MSSAGRCRYLVHTFLRSSGIHKKFVSVQFMMHTQCKYSPQTYVSLVSVTFFFIYFLLQIIHEKSIEPCGCISEYWCGHFIELVHVNNCYSFLKTAAGTSAISEATLQDNLGKCCVTQGYLMCSFMQAAGFPYLRCFLLFLWHGYNTDMPKTAKANKICRRWKRCP